MKIGTGDQGEKFLKKDYPIDEGLDAKINNMRDRSPNLEADESIVRSVERKGL